MHPNKQPSVNSSFEGKKAESALRTYGLLGWFMVVTFLIFSQCDLLFDVFMGVEVHD